VETNADLQVYDLAHLGLVAGIMDRMKLVETVDQQVGPRPNEKVSTGVALKAAVLNALGFVSSPLHLFSHFFQGKPTELLLGPGVTPEFLNDDYWTTSLRPGSRRSSWGLPRRPERPSPLHVDATRFHVHGVYGSGEEGQTVDAGDEPRAIRLTHGYSRDHRPDLQQWVMNRVCADSGGLPLLYAPGDGNPSDRAELVRLVRRYRESLNLGEVVVLDGASYSQENLRALAGFGWILRVPATLKEARALLEGECPREAWLPLLPGYRGLAVEREYGGVRQRWLLVEGEERARLAEEELNRRVARAEGEAQKVLGQLTARSLACEADLRGALAEASARLPFHRLVYLGVKEERKRGRVGRPPKGEPPLAVGYRPLVRVELEQGKLERARRGLGRFLLATNVLDTLRLPAAEVRVRPGRWSEGSASSKTPCSSPQAPS